MDRAKRKSKSDTQEDLPRPRRQRLAKTWTPDEVSNITLCLIQAILTCVAIRRRFYWNYGGAEPRMTK